MEVEKEKLLHNSDEILNLNVKNSGFSRDNLNENKEDKENKDIKNKYNIIF
jgi:hypothetical protein